MRSPDRAEVGERRDFSPQGERHFALQLAFQGQGDTFPVTGTVPMLPAAGTFSLLSSSKAEPLDPEPCLLEGPFAGSFAPA